MKYRKQFLRAVVALACVGCLTCAFLCSRFAPHSVRQQRQAALADARTVISAIRYLMTPENGPESALQNVFPTR